MRHTATYVRGSLVAAMLAAFAMACGDAPAEVDSSESSNLEEGAGQIDACVSDDADGSSVPVLRCEFAKLPLDVSATDPNWNWQPIKPKGDTPNRRQVTGGQVCIMRSSFGKYYPKVSESVRFTYGTEDNVEASQRTITSRFKVFAQTSKATDTGDRLLIEQAPGALEVGKSIDVSAFRLEMAKNDQAGTFEWKRWYGSLLLGPKTATPTFERSHVLKSCKVLGEIK